MRLIGSLFQGVPNPHVAARNVAGWLDGTSSSFAPDGGLSVKPLYLDDDGSYGTLEPAAVGVQPQPCAQFVRRGVAGTNPRGLSRSEVEDLRSAFPSADLWPAAPVPTSGAVEPELDALMSASRAREADSIRCGILAAAKSRGEVSEYFARQALKGMGGGAAPRASSVPSLRSIAASTGVEWLDAFVNRGASEVQQVVSALLESSL